MFQGESPLYMNLKFQLKSLKRVDFPCWGPKGQNWQSLLFRITGVKRQVWFESEMSPRGSCDWSWLEALFGNLCGLWEVRTNWPTWVIWSGSWELQPGPSLGSVLFPQHPNCVAPWLLDPADTSEAPQTPCLLCQARLYVLNWNELPLPHLNSAKYLTPLI